MFYGWPAMSIEKTQTKQPTIELIGTWVLEWGSYQAQGSYQFHAEIS